MGSSSSDRNERVRLDGPGATHRVVESPASSNNVDTDDDWVVQDVRSAYSRFLTPASLKALVDVQDIVNSSIPDDAFSLRRCLPTDRVFHGRSSFPVDFFFMYARVMKDSCIVIPFDDLCSDVLRFLNVAPTQLHPMAGHISGHSSLCVPPWPLLLPFRCSLLTTPPGRVTR